MQARNLKQSCSIEILRTCICSFLCYYPSLGQLFFISVLLYNFKDAFFAQRILFEDNYVQLVYISNIAAINTIHLSFACGLKKQTELTEDMVRGQGCCYAFSHL